MDEDARLNFIEKQLNVIPSSPGVYVIYDKDDNVIYVGKAKNLINRLRSHFAPSTDFSKSRVIREKGYRIKVHEVKSENEAFLLEYNFIQEYMPPLNEKWKDGKTYPYLEITTGEQYPRFQITRDKSRKESIFLGPFSDLGSLKRTLRFGFQLFPVADCDKEIHIGDSEGWAKTCIRRRTRQCLRPCEIPIDETEYKDQLNHVIRIIEGNAPEVEKLLIEKMEISSKNQEFEKAAEYRDIIKSLKRTIERQKVMIDGVEDGYILTHEFNKHENAICLQKIEKGRIVRQETKAISNDELKESNYDIWVDFVINFLINILELHENPNEVNPKRIVVSTRKSKEIINSLKEFGFEPVKPQTEIDKQLVSMTKQHTKQFLQRRMLLMKDQGIPHERVLDLQKMLDMEFPPFIIDTFDISTLLGTNNVASCIRFNNGRPLKKGYRRFKIRSLEYGEQNDFAAMEEVVYRRYRDINEGKDPKGLQIPDLIVIDGGAEQVKRAKFSIDQLGLDILLIGLAKKEEEVYFPDQENPIRFGKNRAGVLLLRAARDEAHRFAITYQRELRLKEGLTSVLDTIEGIGPVRKKKLLQKYKSVETIAKQSSETLSDQIGINQQLASKVIESSRRFLLEQEKYFTTRRRSNS